MSNERGLAVARLPPLQRHPGPGGRLTDLSPRNMRQLEGLTGPSYTLKGGVKHPLPPPAVLRPFRDTNGGTLDAWPAHAQNQMTSNMSIGLGSNKALIVYNEEDVGKQSVVPKPRFLEQLENYLKKELRALGVSEPHPSELRLQAFREVFEYLIEDFKTYKPILAAIKNEYEVLLAHQREVIRDMEPLKQMLVTVSEQCDQKVMALREEEKQVITDLKMENAGLYGRLDGMRNDQKSLQAQVEKLQAEVEEVYGKYRDECDARKLLVSDMNDLRYQQENLEAMRQTADDEEKEQEDPVMLKIALKKAREDMTAAVERLNIMIADYGDVIPRRDFEALEKNHQTLTEQHEKLDDDYLRLQAEHEALLDVHKKLEQQRDEYYTEVEKLQRTATPRPDWDRFAEVMEGGQEKWDELVEKKSSREIADLLVEQISSGSKLGASETTLFFDSHGTGSEVPPYLRFDGGQIHNRKINRRDVLLFIKDIWKEKDSSDTQRGEGREPMAEYLARYLQTRFSLPLLAAEWGYNLHDGAQRLQAIDPRIEFFFNLLTGEADEEQHHELLRTIAQLYKRLTGADEESNGQTNGQLAKDTFLQVLQEVFTNKSQTSIMLLAERAAEELELADDQLLTYRNLFTEDEEGGTGPFLQEVRRQDADERDQYISDIQTALGENTPTEVSPELLQQAVKSVDPELTDVQLNSLLSWVFRPAPDHNSLFECSPLDLNLIKKRLKFSTARRAGPKPTAE